MHRQARAIVQQRFYSRSVWFNTIDRKQNPFKSSTYKYDIFAQMIIDYSIVHLSITNICYQVLSFFVNDLSSPIMESLIKKYYRECKWILLIHVYPLLKKRTCTVECRKKFLF